MPVAPPEADPPLLVDSDAAFALSITLESLELIRAWNRKVTQIRSGIKLLQLHQRPLLDVARKPLGVFAAPNLLGLFAPKGFDHLRIVTRPVSNVNRSYLAVYDKCPIIEQSTEPLLNEAITRDEPESSNCMLHGSTDAETV
jgi:hypothetical protein